MSTEKKQLIDESHYIRHRLYEKKQSSLSKYAEIVIGETSLLRLIKYELITMLVGYIPGAFGLLMRKIFYPMLFKSVGKGVVFGRSIVVRHPNNIKIGDRVVIDDYSLIDARGAGQEGIKIGDDVIVNRYATIQAKVGGIIIGPTCNIGSKTSIISQGGIVIAESVRMAGGCTISGGIYESKKTGNSSNDWERYTQGPIRIDKKCRLGMGTMVLDGVHIGQGTQLAPMSLVSKNLPEYCVAAGIPARPVYFREE